MIDPIPVYLLKNMPLYTIYCVSSSSTRCVAADGCFAEFLNLK